MCVCVKEREREREREKLSEKIHFSLQHTTFKVTLNVHSQVDIVTEIEVNVIRALVTVSYIIIHQGPGL